jgi:hypothetical protein
MTTAMIVANLSGKQGMSATEKVIRDRAYELWDLAGRPDGPSDEFWFAARAEFGGRGRE